MEAPSIQKSLSQNSALSVASSTSSTESARKRNPTDFEFGEILGEGSYSTVILATQASNGKKYAVKVLDKFHIVREKKVKYVTIEKDILQKLKHPLIVKLYYTFQDQASLYFVLEYCANGDLLGYIKAKGRFDSESAKFYGAEILKGLQVIHENQILHRDLKPENILLNHKNHIKITDFGSAIMLDKIEITQGDEKSQRRSSFVGTAEYCSPELLNEQRCTAASDIWALACIIFQMLVGM
jgi:3-phosphoinositide dependent protein kinase-1